MSEFLQKLGVLVAVAASFLLNLVALTISFEIAFQCSKVASCGSLTLVTESEVYSLGFKTLLFLLVTSLMVAVILHFSKEPPVCSNVVTVFLALSAYSVLLQFGMYGLEVAIWNMNLAGSGIALPVLLFFWLMLHMLVVQIATISFSPIKFDYFSIPYLGQLANTMVVFVLVQIVRFTVWPTIDLR